MHIHATEFSTVGCISVAQQSTLNEYASKERTTQTQHQKKHVMKLQSLPSTPKTAYDKKQTCLSVQLLVLFI